MKYKSHPDICDCYCLIDLISSDCLENLNRVFGTNYSRSQIKEKIRVLRAEQQPEFYERLMQTKPGWTKEENV